MKLYCILILGLEVFCTG